MASINDTVPNWLIGTTYNKYAIVSYNSKYYYSLRDGNVGNTPSTTLQTAWDGYIAINALILPNFFWKPSYNSIVNSEPKVVKVQFGNGYQQRIPDGINSNLLNIELQFENKLKLKQYQYYISWLKEKDINLLYIMFQLLIAKALVKLIQDLFVKIGLRTIIHITTIQ